MVRVWTTTPSGPRSSPDTESRLVRQGIETPVSRGVPRVRGELGLGVGCRRRGAGWAPRGGLAVFTLSRLGRCRASDNETGLKREDLARSFVERSNAGDADGVVARYEEHAAIAYPPSCKRVSRRRSGLRASAGGSRR